MGSNARINKKPGLNAGLEEVAEAMPQPSIGCG